MNVIIFIFKGPFAETIGVEGNAFVHSRYSNRSEDWPDLQIFFLSATPVIDGGGGYKQYFGASTEVDKLHLPHPQSNIE